MNYPDIFQYIKGEERKFGDEIEIVDGWRWNMKDHIRQTILYKHGKFAKGMNDFSRPNKNIVMPILNLQYRAEDIDLKDVNIYVDDSEKYHLSFLVKKYHDEVFAQQHKLDDFFDDIKEEKVDFGGVIVRDGKDGPTFEPMESIAFCDQTDILAGPICFKTEYNPDELYEKSKLGWGDKKNGADVSLDDLIDLAKEEKTQDGSRNIKIKTPGKYVQVYRIHGNLPSEWLDSGIKEKYVRQMQIVAFYHSIENDALTGVTLYKSREYENPFKLKLRGKKIRNRALAFGGVEELFDAQIWTNYSEIVKKKFLDAASKILFVTNDDTYATENKIKDLENLEVTTIQEGREIKQLQTTPVNIRLFDQWIGEWDATAKTVGGASDALLGQKQGRSTQAYRAQAFLAQQAQELHNYRKDKFADFIHEIYTDWIIPSIKKEILKGKKFLATLNSEELKYVADHLVRNTVNNEQKEKILSGQLPMNEQEKQAREQSIRENFMARGSQRFIEILKGEFEDSPLKVKVNVANRQKDFVGLVTKLSQIFQQVIANPQLLDNPRAAKVFNKIIQYSGLDPIDFETSVTQPAQAKQGGLPPQFTQTPELAKAI